MLGANNNKNIEREVCMFNASYYRRYRNIMGRFCKMMHLLVHIFEYPMGFMWVPLTPDYCLANLQTGHVMRERSFIVRLS
mmetsp:Transcript_34853/g.64119  ORF Transcript_34853/g.64119 Transcript_34853/m.64119 type:complete len:80 (+) Transcript_34853:326-565(+)